MVRTETAFEEWLQAQRWKGWLTQGKQELTGKAIRSVLDLIKDSSRALVEIAATESETKA